MRLVNLSPGESIIGKFAGWSDWYFNPENQNDVDWLPVLKQPLLENGERSGGEEPVALSNNAGLMARFRTATLGGLLKEDDEVRVDCTGEVKIDEKRRMKSYILRINDRTVEDHQVVSLPPAFLRNPNQLQLALPSDEKER